MPERTVKGVFYLDKEGNEYAHGQTVDFSKEEAARGDSLGSFFESPDQSKDPNVLNETHPGSSVQGPPFGEVPTRGEANTQEFAERQGAEAGLKKLSKDELTQQADEAGIDLTGASTKADIIERIEAAEQG
jgi:hypothetical protein